MSEDWLDTGRAGVQTGVQRLVEGERGEGGSGGLPLLPIPAELPAEPAARLALAQECWARLSDKQRHWLTAFRENRLNARRTSRALYNHDDRRTSHINWMHEPAYRTIVRLWQGAAGSEALDKDRLLARQDDIVETLLTPKPVLHQGIMVRDTRPGAPADAVLEEVEAGAASRANEVLMKAAGLLKDKELEVNVGIVGPGLSIQVMEPNGVVKDATPIGVPIELPEPSEDDWLSVL